MLVLEVTLGLPQLLQSKLPDQLLTLYTWCENFKMCLRLLMEMRFILKMRWILEKSFVSESMEAPYEI